MTASSNEQLNYFRHRLQEDQRLIEEQLRSSEEFGLGDSLRDMTGELTPIDNHPADLATELYERGKDIALLEQKELQLEAIDAALLAIEEGTYGRCVTCGREIPTDRLEAIPSTLYCVDHSPRQHVSANRPVEEDIMQIGVNQTSKNYNEVAGFDGEDSWQIVASWGNSDSPAMSQNRDVEDYDHIAIEAYENDGYVEAVESFLATDITGRNPIFVRNREYERYMEDGEGDSSLEVE